MSRKRGNDPQMRLEARRVVDPARAWFVLQVVTASEERCEETLRAEKVDVWVPRFSAVTVRRGRKVEGRHPFFPGYLFAGLDREVHARRWTATLHDTPQVIDILGVEGPLEMPSDWLQALADRVTGNTRTEKLSAAALFRIEEMRPVIHGPFVGFMATVREILATGRIKADVAIFGRETPVEFDPAWLGAA
ncbi:transcription termination/antitermination protein NusG [Methylobacterium brachiatum]|uniref:transcription termination/antitermination protein NusG n=1 Tax=Methylobacterium brachiatum TaxID=269660 RepID=UPI0024485470|nr:transcription termination/antitermination NusG family protein [Methylobacterium brachiatum]MDH2310355.1 transcription termination/antitermination NusG family protein [Methylobacterium brachiatum]